MAGDDELSELFEQVIDVAAGAEEITPEYIAHQMVVQGDRVAKARGKHLTPTLIREIAAGHVEQSRRVADELERIAAQREGH